MTELSPSSIKSHYRTLSKIGACGMGEVYLAQDTSEPGRTVALKILPSAVAQDKDRLQRFTQEARAVSNVNHPNILTVYEFGQSDSASFIATEYIDLQLHEGKTRLIESCYKANVPFIPSVSKQTRGWKWPALSAYGYDRNSLALFSRRYPKPIL
jgi:serine/threonine protein kinase